jgi:hypothetical protein
MWSPPEPPDPPDDPDFEPGADLESPETEPPQQPGVQGVYFHEAATQFAMLAEADIAKLMANIKAYGLDERTDKIATFEDQILDGRGLALALDRLGRDIRPHLIALPEDIDPKRYVIRKNRDRRQLNKIQLAKAGNMWVTATWGGSRRGNRQSDGSSGINSTWRKPVSCAEAAKELRVNVKQIRLYQDFVKKTPATVLRELNERIDAGAIPTANMALDIVTVTPKDEAQGVTTPEQKARKWLDSRFSGLNRSAPAQKREPPILTDKRLKTYTNTQLAAFMLKCADMIENKDAAVVMEKLAPKANRELAYYGERWTKGPIKA